VGAFLNFQGFIKTHKYLVQLKIYYIINIYNMSVRINAQDLNVGTKYIFIDMNKNKTYMGTLEEKNTIGQHNTMGNEYFILTFEGKSPKTYNWDDKFEMYIEGEASIVSGGYNPLKNTRKNKGRKKRRRTKRKQRRRKTSRR
jgi:hypothetical protein